MVYIYAESLERTYFDKSLFPDLLNSLAEIKKQSTDFTEINQITGSGWTIGGMVTSQCSVPLFTTSQGNSMKGVDAYYQGANCLGDTLKHLGYHLSFMQGSSAMYSGISQFYATHSFDEIQGREQLKKGLKDRSYVASWGLYDDTLFDLVYEKFNKLSEKAKPFGLFMATMDMHPPGNPSKSCKDRIYADGKNSMLNAAHCSDYLIARFIKKIQNSPYGKKTLIVLTSDHLTMKSAATELLEKGKRRDLFLIWDPNNKKYTPIDKAGSMLDVSPTVLHKLGIDTDFGLGRNLFSKESLLKKFEYFNKKIYSWRNDILEFWNFSKLDKSYKINLPKRTVDIASHHYGFPVLFKIDNSNTLKPFFEFNSPKKLYDHLREFNAKQKFIWIDKCQKLDFIFRKDSEADICAAQGSLYGDIEYFDLIDDNISLMTKNIATNSKIDSKQYSQRMKKLNLVSKHHFARPEYGKEAYSSSLEEGIIFSHKGYPKFIKKVCGISVPESWGRWSDANLAKSVKIVLKDKLPKNFFLELDVGSYGDNIGKPIQIKIGNQIKTFIIKEHNNNKYIIAFSNVDSKSIIITPPNPQSPGIDPRKLGIGFVTMRIKQHK